MNNYISITILFLVCTAVAFAALFGFLWWLNRPTRREQERLIERVRSMSLSDAVARVEQLLECGELDANICRLKKDIPLGEAARVFFHRFEKLSNDQAEFYLSECGEDIGSSSYFLVGHTVELETRFYAQKHQDTIRVLDVEDFEFDRFIQYPSIWHAVYFECRRSIETEGSVNRRENRNAV